MNKEEVRLYIESMTTEEAIGEVENALSNYRSESLSTENEEGDRELLDKAWDLILNKVQQLFSMILKLTDREKLHIMDEALSHIKKVEADPDVDFENVDTYDAWYSFNERIDFNVFENR